MRLESEGITDERPVERDEAEERRAGHGAGVRFGAYGGVLVGLLTALAGLLAFQQIRDLDIGFHLRAGEWIIDRMRFPGADVFTYTVTSDYIDLYWLYQVILAAIDAIGGEFLLVAVNALLVMVNVYLVVRRHATYGASGSILSGGVLLAAILATAYHFTIRPHVFSWLYLNLMLLTLENYREGRGGALWPLPVLMLLWVNSHTLFVLGWGVLGCHVVGSIVERRGIDRRLLAYAAAAVVICLVNPYGLKGIWLPFQQLGFLQAGNPFKELIAEYASPFAAYSFDRYIINGRFVLLQPTFFFHLFVLLSVVGFVGKIVADRGRRLADILLFLFFAAVLFSAFKNIGYFVFALLPMTIYGIDRLSLRLTEGRGDRERKGSSRRMSLIASVAWSALVVAALLRVATDAYYIGYRGQESTGYSYAPYRVPMDAADFLLKHRLRGRILNHFNYGGILMYRTSQRVFIDARNEVMGEEFFNVYRKMFTDAGRSEILRTYTPDIVIFPYATAGKWQEYFMKRGDWRLVFVDGAAAVYLRNGYAEQVPALDQERFLATLPNVSDREIEEVLERRDYDGFVGGFFGRQYFPRQEIDMAGFCLLNGWLEGAVRVCVGGLQRTTVEAPELYHKLGVAFRFRKERELALRAYQRYLETIDDPKTERIVQELGR